MNSKDCLRYRNGVIALGSGAPSVSSEIRETMSHLMYCDDCIALYLSVRNNGGIGSGRPGGEIQTVDLFTNRTKELEFLAQIENALSECEYAAFNVAFVMRSGLGLLKEHIRKIISRGCRVDLLTGTYMNATQPAALSELLLEFGDKINLRCYKNELGSFHPKVYYFKFKNSKSTVFVGSSNITYTALKTGVEWNCKISAEADEKLFNKIEAELSDLLSDENSVPVTPDFIRAYETAWKPNTIHSVEKTERRSRLRGPNPAQAIALLQLKDTREEGYKKALVAAATGIGKTFLAAMDSTGFKKILFVAHVEEILDQAAETFKAIHPDKTIGKFCGSLKESDKDIIFASIQSISKPEYLNKYFKPAQFDYIVVDEFHHAAARSYKTVLEYFNPQFLLGLTATPDRMDNLDIYSLCDQNIAYSASLKKAIESQWLVPFFYHAVFDEAVNYEAIKYNNGKYDDKELETCYISSPAAMKRASVIIEKYRQYRPNEKALTVAFCSSIKHADYMAEKFLENKIAALPLHSKTADFFANDRLSALCKKVTGSGAYSRKEAIAAFENRKITVLFVVDIFNEGIDIPHIEMELFLRPTESFTIFIQQLGRGLRTFEGKNHLIVLDFIGNYKKANFKPLFLSGQPLRDGDGRLRAIDYIKTPQWLPEGCFAEFDFRVINLFTEMEKKKTPLEIEMLNTYDEISLEHRPTMNEFFSASSYSHKLLMYKYDSWLDFIKQTQKLTAEETDVISNRSFYDFFTIIEKTKMTKSYKIPVIYSFLNDTSLHESRTLSEIASYFKMFYLSNEVFVKDIINAGSSISAIKDFDDFKKVAATCETMPVKFLTNGPEAAIFEYDKTAKIMKLKNPALCGLGEAGVSLIKELLNFRINDYFRRRF